MKNNEEDTFNRLKRIPYDQIEEIWQNDLYVKGPWETNKVFGGWTWEDFTDEHDRRATHGKINLTKLI